MSKKVLGYLALVVMALAGVFALLKSLPRETESGPPTLRVAVLDTGVEPGLKSSPPARVHFQQGWNFFHENADTTDENSHGSRVTRIVIEAFLRLAPPQVHLEIIPLKIVKNESGLSAETLARALDLALENRARLVVLAFGITENNPALRASVEKVTKEGALLVLAAGHGIKNPYRPQPLEEIFPQAYGAGLVIGATRELDRLDPLANFGPQLDTVLWQDPTAPHAADTYGSSYAAALVGGILSGTVLSELDASRLPSVDSLRQKIKAASQAQKPGGPALFSEKLWLEQNAKKPGES